MIRLYSAFAERGLYIKLLRLFYILLEPFVGKPEGAFLPILFLLLVIFEREVKLWRKEAGPAVFADMGQGLVNLLEPG
ncbi:hypothetical protein [Larkinella arboricola]|uniref:hypothetical protein n=1 Tax=Larkinella arboricola TaxID=643671 RepID=UPI0011BA63E7|nr:hypothetical protein [Larkinella arboricola]